MRSFAFQDDIVAAVETGEISASAVAASIVGWYRHEHPDTTVTIPTGYEPEPALHWNIAIALLRADDVLLGHTRQPGTPQRIGVLLVGFTPQRKPAQAFREALRDAGLLRGARRGGEP